MKRPSVRVRRALPILSVPSEVPESSYDVDIIRHGVEPWFYA